MNRIFLYMLLFLLSYIVYALEMNMNLKRIDTDFNGVAFSSKAVICYGDGSVLLISYDKGNNWEQENIFHDSLDIRKMICINDMFIGILNKEFIVTGDINAKNWETFYTGIQNQQSIAYNDNRYFILSNNEIHTFDEDFKEVNRINIRDTNKYSEIAIFKHYLLAGGTNGILALFDINDNFKESTFDFKTISFCLTCPNIWQLNIKDTKAYLSFGSDVYESQELISWTLKGKSISLYDIKDDFIFYIRTNGTVDMPASLLETWTIDSLKNKKLSYDWQVRNVDILAFTDFKFIDDKHAFAVGREKTIARTTDRGLHWELVSNFKPGGFKMLNDSIYFSMQPKARIYRTLNSGNTWLPPIITNNQMTRFGSSVYTEFHENGYGFVINNTPFHNVDNLLQTYDYGNSYTLSKIENFANYLSYDAPSFIKTDKGYNVIISWGISKVPLTSLIKLDTGLKFVSCKNIYDSLQIVSIKKINDNEYLGMAKDMHWPYYVDGDDKSFNYWFLKSADNGETWEKQFEVFMADTSLMPILNKFGTRLLIGGSHLYKEKRDTPNVNQLYIIDIETGKRTRLFNDVVASYGLITKYKDNLIFGGWECLFVNSNYREDLSSWDKFSIRGKYFIGIYNYYENLFFQFFDIYSRKINIYNASIDFITDVEKKTETKTYLYSFPPYPNPASNLVRADIYWDTRYDIDEADIGIFNYAGIKISDKKNITIDKKSNFGGTLVWDCSAYSPGVYFLIIKHGYARRVIPVVVGE